MNAPTRLHWLGGALARVAGDDARVQELLLHLDDAVANGRAISIADVGSVAALAVRHRIRLVVRDLPWWLAGAPIALLVIIPLGLVYETHFFAWDMIEEQPTSQAARNWKTAIDVMTWVGIVAALLAGRRCVEYLRRGRLIAPAGLLLSLLIASSQTDLFVEHTAWWRDGSLQARHIEEVSPYSVALFFAVALVPVAFLVVDRALSRKLRRIDTPRPATLLNGPDGMAIGVVVLPLLHFAIGIVWFVPFLALLWISTSFSRRLQILTTAVLLTPAIAMVAWVALVAPIDDGTAVLWIWLGGFAACWLRLGVVAISPVLHLRLQTAN